MPSWEPSILPLPISKSYLGKLADITSRPTSYVVLLIVHAVGLAIAASSPTLAAYIVGAAMTAFGRFGLALLSDIVVGNLPPLQWRSFRGCMLSSAFLTTLVNGFISDACLRMALWAYLHDSCALGTCHTDALRHAAQGQENGHGEHR